MHRRVQVEVGLVHRPERCRLRRVQAAEPRRAHLPAGPGEEFLRSRCPGHQGDREDHQPRREGGGVLDQVASSRPGPSWRTPASSCTSPAPAKTSTTPATRCSCARRATWCCCRRWTRIMPKLRDMAHAYADVPMLSRTHGQTASPTTVGKEIANVVVRLQARARADRRRQAAGQDERRRGQLQRPPVGLARLRLGSLQPKVIETPEPLGLGLTFQPYSIQIEPHDYMAELFDAVARTNTILIDLARDVWGYVSLGYFKQRLKDGESRLLHHAAQGQPDRLRERRRQPGPGQCAAAPPERKAADQPLAARPDRLHRAAQHGRGAGLCRAGLQLADDRPEQARTQRSGAWPTTWTPPGKCWPSRSRP